ncbi:hypothetical protein [Methyloceanibacter caenitepidi]|uniref:Uncharacterized protein n=1 Tax=Methyloceanibacter caenitepidi TaxID=1384459 RepID=A0A0A8K6E7_9HYPH|nr:hypothetical protein [Methyloceanibacter caenitepidi]BAQ18475.1 hypothetical protein GL4_3043 [Methyloceanibacter caenitepidi]
MGTGATEIIRLFAGHFHLSNETGRLRESYDEFMAHRARGDFDPGTHDAIYKSPDLDEFHTYSRFVDPQSEPPGLVGYGPLSADPLQSEPRRLDINPIIDNALPDELAAPGAPLLIAAPTLLQYEIEYGELAINVTYDTGGDQHLIQVQQLNVMWDNDIAIPEGWSAEALQTLQFPDIPDTLQDLHDQAVAAAPPELSDVSFNTGSLISFAGEYDAEWKASGETTRNDVEPGVYVNGELQPEDAELPVFPVGLGDDGEAESAYPTDVPGQIVTAGSNLAANVAGIFDINHGIGTLVVVGDYFRTDAIVQLNLYVDDDDITYAGDGVFQIEGDGNEAFNIATFLDTDAGVPSFAGSDIFPGIDWYVDVLDGDLYDVSVVSQANWLYDNDVSVQDNYLTNYQLLMGANEQGNFTEILTIGDNYDLVIVLGDYHELNLIYQKNILLDPDTLKVLGYDDAFGDGDGLADPSITAGANWLQNEALIEQWGTQSFQELTPAWEALIAQLNAGDTELDLSAGVGIPNFGDPAFNILLITGDVYDINAIEQENVVADADVALQLLPPAAAHEDPAMQVASTGENALGNFATIVHTGPAADYYIGGELYEDEMLIQTELIASNDDTVTGSDPDVLANELVAFTLPPEEDGHDEDAVAVPVHDSAHSDVLGNVLT